MRTRFWPRSICSCSLHGSDADPDAALPKQPLHYHRVVAGDAFIQRAGLAPPREITAASRTLHCTRAPEYREVSGDYWLALNGLRGRGSGLAEVAKLLAWFTSVISGISDQYVCFPSRILGSSQHEVPCQRPLMNA